MMLPSYERLDASKSALISIHFRRLAVLDAGLPLCGFACCIIWCLIYDFEHSTATHCGVPNFLPSVSAVTGNYEPQRLMWRLAAIMHLPVRVGVARLYVQYQRGTVRREVRAFAAVACVLHVLESVGVLGMTIWTSTDDYTLHCSSFMLVIVSSLAYMSITYLLIRHGRKVPLTPIEAKSLRYKRNLCLINVASFIIAGYCFVRHNSLCEPGMYSVFALFEYIFVYTIMFYHMTAYYDFYAFQVNFDWVNGLYITQGTLF